MTRRRGGTQTRILWLLYCQLYDSPYPTYYLNDKELLFYTDYVWMCVLFYRSQQSCQRNGTSGSPLHFVSLRLRQHGLAWFVWRYSEDALVGLSWRAFLHGSRRPKRCHYYFYTLTVCNQQVKEQAKKLSADEESNLAGFRTKGREAIWKYSSA